MQSLHLRLQEMPWWARLGFSPLPGEYFKIQKLLREEYASTELAIVGAMVDENDSAQMVQNYLKENQLPYALAEPWSETDRESFNLLVNARLESDVLPATVIVNARLEVVSVIVGVPTVSDIARLIPE